MSTPRTRGCAILSTPPTADEFFSAILSQSLGGNNSVQRLGINRNSISIYLIFGNSSLREFLRLCIFKTTYLHVFISFTVDPVCISNFILKFQVVVYRYAYQYYFVSMKTYVSSQTCQYIYKCMLHLSFKIHIILNYSVSIKIVIDSFKLCEF